MLYKNYEHARDVVWWEPIVLQINTQVYRSTEFIVSVTLNPDWLRLLLKKPILQKA